MICSWMRKVTTCIDLGYLTPITTFQQAIPMPPPQSQPPSAWLSIHGSSVKSSMTLCLWGEEWIKRLKYVVNRQKIQQKPKIIFWVSQLRIIYDIIIQDKPCIPTVIEEAIKTSIVSQMCCWQAAEDMSNVSSLQRYKVMCRTLLTFS